MAHIGYIVVGIIGLIVGLCLGAFLGFTRGEQRGMQYGRINGLHDAIDAYDACAHSDWIGFYGRMMTLRRKSEAELQR